jgi:alpha-amylase
MSNGCDGIKTMKVGSRHANKVFIDYLENHAAEVLINENGFGIFYCKAGSVSVWIEK